jgi:hypothetical protein
MLFPPRWRSKSLSHSPLETQDAEPPRPPDHYVTASELARCGLNPRDVLRVCPGATEYAGLDGESGWLRDELAPLLLRDPEDFAS